jgi:DNA-binding NtrC family response regulator
MDSIKALLLDTHHAGDAAARLRDILIGAQFDAHLKSETAAGVSLAAAPHALTELVSADAPGIVYVLLPRGAAPEAGEVLAAVRAGAPSAPLVAVAGSGGPDELLALLRLGFDDFLTTPLRDADIVPRACRLLRLPRGEEEMAVRTLKERLGLRQLVGQARAFLEEVAKIPLVARCDANVMISGETGTGKEMCARAVHYLSPRARAPFVPVNCGAIPLDLVENELFGHERGAYTGASTAEGGLIEAGDGGTLFLDEIDCLPLLAQVKLLRFLQEKEYRPLGSARTRKANVRVIVASNVDLEEAVRQGKLRQDLYYRLNVIPLRLPPLRERREDIPVLARHFLAGYAAEFGKEARDFTVEAVGALTLYDWPGNVRELQHVVERAVVLSEGRVVGADALALPCAAAPRPRPESFKDVKARVVAQFEKSYLLETLLACDGNITKAAQLARKNRRAFWQLIRKHGIDVSELKFNT